MVSILLSELIKDQILHPQPLLQENSYMRLLFHQQIFCPSARHYDISARTKTSSLNCHQPCLRRIKTPQLPPCDVSQKCHFYLQQVTPQLTVSMSFQGEGAEGGKGEMMAAAINMTADMLDLLSDAKFSFADSVRHALLVAQRAATVLPGSSEGLTGFGVLGVEGISSSFGHNTFF